MSLNPEIINKLINYFEEQIEINNERDFGATESLNAWSLLQIVNTGLTVGDGGSSTTISLGIDNSADIELIKDKIDLLRNVLIDFQSDVNSLNLAVSTDGLENLIEEVKVKLDNILLKIPSQGIKPQSESISVVPATGSNFAPNSLTNSQLRAAPISVDINSIPLPNNSATESTLTDLNNKIPSNLSVIGTINDNNVGPLETGTLNSRLRYLSDRVGILTAPRLNYRVFNSNNSLLIPGINNKFIKTLYVTNLGSQDIFIQFFDSINVPTEGNNSNNEVYVVFSGGGIIIGEDYYWGEGLKINDNLYIGISTSAGMYIPASGLNYNLAISYR